MFIKTLVLLITTFILSLSAPLFGQENIVEYKGEYKINEHTGKAHFSYKVVNDDTLLNGDFTFVKSNLNQLVSGSDNTLLVEGAFNANKPVGLWKFEIGTYSAHQFKGNTVNNNHYEIKLDGSVHTVSGMLSNGVLDGSWEHTVKDIYGSELETTRFNSQIEYNQGTPQRNFKIENESALLMGLLQRDGLAHDVWEMFSKEDPDVTESWNFNQGLLKYIEVNTADTNINVAVFNKTKQHLSTINLDKHYLDIVKFQLLITGHPEEDIKDGLINLLYQNTANYSKINKLLSAITVADLMPKFKVKVPTIPLSDEEAFLLDSIALELKKAETKVSRFLKSSQLNIMKLSDEDVSFHLAALELLAEKHLALIRNVVYAKQHKVLQHIERENLAQQLCKTYACTTKRINVVDPITEASKTYTVKNAADYNFNAKGVNGLMHFTNFVSALVSEIEGKLNIKLDLNTNEQELLEVEETLYTTITKLDKHIDSLRATSTNKINNVLLSVKGFAKNELKAYSAKKNSRAKLEQAPIVQQCLQDLFELTTTVSLTTKRQKEIKALYIDAVWNPFTSTVMNEDVKPRIITAYKNVLIPYLLDEVEHNLSCKKVSQLSKLYNGVYDRMLELREEETNKLERKLRKEKDPIVVLDLFTIKIKSSSDL